MRWTAVVASVQTISEAHLLPVIEQMLAQFPFEILGFHADNGSEYVNHRVAEMLDKLRIEFTRSCPRRSNDNGLAETKNGVVVRKLFGYAHIPQRHASRFNTFCVEYLNPFLNFHRPCLFATEVAERATGGPGAARPAGLCTYGRCAYAHRRRPWTTHARCPPPAPSPTTMKEPNPGLNTLRPSTTDRLASRRRSQAAPGSYLNWKRLQSAA